MGGLVEGGQSTPSFPKLTAWPTNDENLGDTPIGHEEPRTALVRRRKPKNHAHHANIEGHVTGRGFQVRPIGDDYRRSSGDFRSKLLARFQLDQNFNTIACVLTRQWRLTNGFVVATDKNASGPPVLLVSIRFSRLS